MFEWGSRTLSVRAATIRTQGTAEVGSAALIRDVTEERQREEQLVVLSTTDVLTGLFNRRYLDDGEARTTNWPARRAPATRFRC